MAQFVLKNNYFEFNSHVKHEISGTVRLLELNLYLHMHAFSWMK